MSFTPSGDGSHRFLYLQKTSANTQWVARQLARFAGVRNADVGYAGLKDRHAVARQWFSVPCAREARRWQDLDIAGVEIIETARNARKLRRGAILHNEFVIRLRDIDGDPAELARRLDAIGARGVPNYFGEQRFGINFQNLQLAQALVSGQRLGREKRTFALSAARSYLFNEILARRVTENSWETALPGELLILDGRNSFFAAETIDEELLARCAAGDLHASGMLFGRGSPDRDNEVGQLERDVLDRYTNLCEGLERAGLTMDRRALRVIPRALHWSITGEYLELGFRLPAGSYATAVLRELTALQPARQ